MLLETDSAWLDSTGIGIIKIVEAAEAVTVVGALVLPTTITEGNGVVLLLRRVTVMCFVEVEKIVVVVGRLVTLEDAGIGLTTTEVTVPCG